MLDLNVKSPLLKTLTLRLKTKDLIEEAKTDFNRKEFNKTK